MKSMANLSDILRSYTILQSHRYAAEFVKFTTSSGILQLTITRLMSFVHISDEAEVAAYEKYLRKDRDAKGFRDLVGLEWHKNSYGADKIIYLNIEASAGDILELLSVYNISQPLKEAASAIEKPLVDEAINVPPFATPPLKRLRKSKLLEYSPATLAKYSKEVESKFLEVVQGTLESANDDLRIQVVKEVISRLESRYDGIDTDRDNVNNIIVQNIKHLVTSMTKYGRNDREQIRFKENIALAISGQNSFARLIEATGLSRRHLENARSMREVFQTETEKAEMENDGEENIIQNDDASEVDSDADSGGDETDEEVDLEIAAVVMPLKRKRD